MRSLTVDDADTSKIVYSSGWDIGSNFVLSLTLALRLEILERLLRPDILALALSKLPSSSPPVQTLGTRSMVSNAELLFEIRL